METLPLLLTILLHLALFLLMAAGVILTIIGLPGIWAVFLSFVLTSLLPSGSELTPIVLLILFIFSLAVTVIDNILIPVGAKKSGAGKWGIVGSIIGSIVGLFFGSLLGLLLGSFLGAVLFELLFERKQFDQAFKAGIGTFLGFVTSVMMKVAFEAAMILFWFYIVLT